MTQRIRPGIWLCSVCARGWARLTTVAAVLTLTLASVAAAQEPGLLYATAGAGRQLAAINLHANAVRVVGDIGIPLSISLAFCRPGGVAYTITNFFNPTNAQLAELNLGTGAATLVGSPLGQDLSIMGMTCAPDGTLYAVGQLDPTDPDFNSLYSVDRRTGLATLVGSTGVSEDAADGWSGFFMALAFAPDGTLYAVNTSALFSIDPTTGAATKVVDFVGVASVMGLDIDQSGNFYLSNWEGVGTIYALDVSTGEAAPLLNTGLMNVHNIAFKAPGTRMAGLAPQQ
jgi:DNA-binding beta-propeller fold protein YncE